jgi:hypothetical protein
MKEAPGSSETSVLTRATRRNNPEDTIHLPVYTAHVAENKVFHNHHRRNFRSPLFVKASSILGPTSAEIHWHLEGGYIYIYIYIHTHVCVCIVETIYRSGLYSHHTNKIKNEGK